MVGSLATVLSFILLNIFWYLGLSPIWANTVSTGLCMIFSFVLNKNYTFRSHDKNYLREIVLFIIFTLLGLWVIQNLVMFGLLTVLPVEWSEAVRLNGAKLLATGASTAWNFMTYSKIIWQKK